VTSKLKRKQKQKPSANCLWRKKFSINDLIKIAQSSKDPIKATCIEAIEFATKSKPEIASSAALNLFAGP
jgi:hypothetical protein